MIITPQQYVENAIGPAASKIYFENAEKNSVYLEKLQPIIERFIDENDVRFEIENGKVKSGTHPFRKFRWDLDETAENCLR